MPRKIVLQIDGGGIRGMAPAIVLAEIEQRIRIKRDAPALKLYSTLDLCCGTSTGAIMAAMVCVGIDAAKIKDFYLTTGANLFKQARTPIYEVLPKYDRDEFIQAFRYILTNFSVSKNTNITLGELPTGLLFMATAYNLCSYRTHFIKSQDQRDLGLRLQDVVTWSGLSAAYYFGKVLAPDYNWTFTNCDTPPGKVLKPGAVFQDGGQGTENCTLGYVLTEVLARRWTDNGGEVLIISLGTGNHTEYQEYNDAMKTSELAQTIRYLQDEARPEAMPEQVLAARYVEETQRLNHKPKLHLFRLDFETDKGYDLDDVNNLAVYQAGAASILSSPTFDNLIQEF